VKQSLAPRATEPSQPPSAANGSRRGAAAGQRQDADAGDAPQARKRRARPKGPSKNRLSAQEQAEEAVEQAEGAMRALEDELSEPAAWATRYESAKSEARHTAAKRAVEDAYARLESLVE
jgi:ATP-binding cassette subfamily F protein 3